MTHSSKPRIELSLDSLLQALSIVEGPTLKVSGLKLIGARSKAFKQLQEQGVLRHAGQSTSITCQECDRRHRAPVAYDHSLQAMTYFCREAGSVAIDPRALDLYELSMDWMLDWFIDALRIPKTQRPIPLLGAHLWELGQANIHCRRLRVMLARKIGSLERLAKIQAIAARRTGKTGVILTTSSGFSEPHRLPNGFSLVGLKEVLAEDRSDASIDVDRLLTIIEPEATIDPFSTGVPGRRSGAHFIKAEHDRRTAEDKTSAKLSEEARILERWYAEHHLDGPPLTVGTIENLIRENHNRQRSMRKPTK